MLSPSVDGAPWAGVASVPWDGAPADSIGMSTSGGLKCATSDVRTHFRILSGAAGSFPSADSCCSAPGRARTDGTTHSRRQQLHYQLLSFLRCARTLLVPGSCAATHFQGHIHQTALQHATCYFQTPVPKHAFPSTDPRVLIQNVHRSPHKPDGHASGVQGHRMAGRHANATVSREEFRDCCLAYLDERGRDHGLEAGWTWQAGLLPGTGYLYRRWELLWRKHEGADLSTGQCALRPYLDTETQETCLDVTDDWGVSEEHGAPAAAGAASETSIPLTVDQSVCWSPIWHVPVLYFTVVYQGMSYMVQRRSPRMGHP